MAPQEGDGSTEFSAKVGGAVDVGPASVYGEVAGATTFYRVEVVICVPLVIPSYRKLLWLVKSEVQRIAEAVPRDDSTEAAVTPVRSSLRDGSA